MCNLNSLFGGGAGPQQQAAQQMALIQQQQAAHDQAVNTDIGEVDKAFSQFDPAYYSAYTKAYEDNYNPQLDYQYGQAQDQMKAQLADNDQLSGSTGAYDLGNLYQAYGTARNNIANSAVDATNGLRNQVSNAKSNLYGLAENAANPLTIATQAQADSGALVSPQSYPSLANVFASVLSPIASASKANSGALPSGGSGTPNPIPLAPV